MCWFARKKMTGHHFSNGRDYTCHQNEEEKTEYWYCYTSIYYYTLHSRIFRICFQTKSKQNNCILFRLVTAMVDRQQLICFDFMWKQMAIDSLSRIHNLLEVTYYLHLITLTSQIILIFISEVS